MKRRRKPDNTNNRPISFTSEDGQSIVTCGYDYMGRRYMKKITVGGVVKSHHHYLYRGYLQIAALDLTVTGAPALWFTHWDPTQPIATRPLSIRKNGTWYTYGHDLTKNVTEFYKKDGTLEAAYDYTPYGYVKQQGTDNQPFQWSSEFYDAELGAVYYNYRHYNPMDGRWISRDDIGEKENKNKTDCCTITLFVDPPDLKAVKNNVLNVAIDTGHTWVELHEKDATSTFSVGPNAPIGKGSLDDFESGNLDGVIDFPIESHQASAVSKEWKLTKKQCKKAKKLFKTKQKMELNILPTINVQLLH